MPRPTPIDPPLRLSPTPAPARRGTVPWIASAVPVVGALVLWAVSRNATMLWFAALGPAIAAATLLDGARAARRDRHRAQAVASAERERVLTEVARRHADERESAWARHPDAARLVAALDGVTAVPAAAGVVRDEVWRRVSGRDGQVVVGAGDVPSDLRVDVDAADPEAADVAACAAVLRDGPVRVPWDDGIVVTGPDAAAAAFVRALVLQVCVVHPPARLRVDAPTARAAGADAGWLQALPHVGASGAGTLLAVCAPGVPAPADADVVIARVPEGWPAPPGARAVLRVTSAVTARLVVDDTVQDVRWAGLGLAQALLLARRLADRARRADGTAALPQGVRLAELLESARVTPARTSLAAVVGADASGPVMLDLVADGPHAVVAGVTGAGKSALLATWITSLCATRTTDEVTFLLADFKGGTAFDALAALPHVTGVITDLDGDGAARALQSLRAEMRRREARIVAVGGADAADTDLPRLVVVVDEFAALAAAHPGLRDLFTDIAARGRALGVHLILGTQRAAGTFSDALLANCPLRISLRVTDGADSTALIGVPDAADLPGDPGRRGLALVRTGSSGGVRRVQIALCTPEVVAAVAADHAGQVARRPWLPALPPHITAAEVRARATPEPDGARGHDAADDVLLGLADEPDRQRQVPAWLHANDPGLGVVGAARSGRTTALRTIAAGAAHARWARPDPEAAWDLLTECADRPPQSGTVLLVDDVDALMSRLPPDYAGEAAARLERIIHSCGGGAGRIALSARRLTGATARLFDLLPRRAILALPSRTDHIAAGGRADRHREGMPPGRALLDGRLIQWATPDPGPAVSTVSGPIPVAGPAVAADWTPRAAACTGVVVRPGPAREAVIAAARTAGAVVRPVAGTTAATEDAPPVPPAGLVLVGDGDDWQRAWRVLQRIRAEGDLLVDAACGVDYRTLTGDRELPPYCRPGRGRAWLVAAGRPVCRVHVPDSRSVGPAARSDRLSGLW